MTLTIHLWMLVWLTPLFLLLAWFLYIAVMGLQKVKDELHPAVRTLGYIGLFVIGYPADLVLQLLGTIIFLDLPKEFMFTARMKRYIATDNGRRCKVATFICAQMLNPFSSGKHC